MNYLAHGRDCLADPWQLAGTALPDWLRVLGRRPRVHAEDALPHDGSADPALRALAHGVLRHHREDAWFHTSEAFRDVGHDVAGLLRAVLPRDAGHRPRFLGHLVLEVLLDAALAEKRPGLLDAYYHALDEVDPDRLAELATALAGADASRLGPLVRRFREARFLGEYASDEGVRHRLGQVLRRVRQPALPAAFLTALPPARQAVLSRLDDLLPPPSPPPPTNSR